ncbi:MAG: SAM-dependent methyltransferase [Anaerotignum sp.]
MFSRAFRPREKKDRRAVLSTLERQHRTMNFYEAPHRLLDTLEELEKIFGSDREMAAIRELTKKFEEVRRGTVAEIKAHFTAQLPKGEVVSVFARLYLAAAAAGGTGKLGKRFHSGTHGALSESKSQSKRRDEAGGKGSRRIRKGKFTAICIKTENKGG